MMESLFIHSTKNTPLVEFNTKNCDFTIEGNSIMTEVFDFYDPIIKWLENYSENPPKGLFMQFDMNYYNLSTAKHFMFMVSILNRMKQKGCSIFVEWRFFDDDEFMREFGDDLSGLYDIPFILISKTADHQAHVYYEMN